jgi:hypothetical protein
MIDRRDMLKLVAVGVVGAVVAGGRVHGGHVTPAREDGLRFSVEGDMGVVRATSAGDSILFSGKFAERTTFTLG